MLLSSLRSRIFLASALLAVLSIAVAIYLVNVRVTQEAESALKRDIEAAGALVDQLSTTRIATFTRMAELIADAPKLKAAVDTNDPATVQDVASGYQEQLESNLLVITNDKGLVLASAGASHPAAADLSMQPTVRGALAGRVGSVVLPRPDGMLQLVSVPIVVGVAHPDILGTLNAGFLLDGAMAAQLKRITGSDIAFGMDGRILASTLPSSSAAGLAAGLRTTGVSSLRVGAEDYVVFPRPLEPGRSASRAVALVLRSRTEQLASLRAIHAGLAVTAIVAVLVATILSFAVARTITRPLAAITAAMRDVAATGDLTRKIVLRHSRWDDEDARLLASTFNTLTESVARFQLAMAQKERLSSLGRLSTVIAHEIRNPLMIIKASLHGLRRSEVTSAEAHEAAADIDEEVVRLNRLVNDVLDFARPIAFDVRPADLNALCRESALAAQASGSGPAIRVEIDPAMPLLSTDPERLRLALVNMLVNARHAAAGAAAAAVAPGGGEPALVTLRTHAGGDRAAIVIADRGVGIAPADLPRVFEPYFTTKRGGTGLGLAIAKNIVEGLGGTIGVASAPGRGTEIRLEFPVSAPAHREAAASV
ncbi:MAG: ATP-binding protein [Betaproteobacteria bacterium]